MIQKCFKEGKLIFGVFNEKTGIYEDKTEEWSKLRKNLK